MNTAAAVPVPIHRIASGVVPELMNTASRGRHRVRHLLMGGQVALALVLLISSGLLLRSLDRLVGEGVADAGARAAAEGKVGEQENEDSTGSDGKSGS